MNEILINKFVTLNNINKVAKKEGIILEDFETNLIYNYIKKNWKTICYGDPTNIFLEAKKKLRIEVYNTIVNLYKKYKPYIN